MMRFLLGAALVWSLGVSWAASPALAQGSLLSNEQLRSVGLELAWHSQLEFDATRGRLAGVYLQYNPSRQQTLFEITHPFGREVISERDLNPFGRPLGVERARAKAEAWLADWEARHPKEKTKPTLREIVSPDAEIISAAQRGMVQCLNAETGSTLWTVKVGSDRLPTSVPGSNEEFVAVLNGSTLYVLKKEDGEIAWQRATTYPPGGGPVLSTQFVFVPMVNGILESYALANERRPASNIRSHGRLFVQPVVFHDVVAWTTDRGMVYAGNSEATGVRFRIGSQDVGVVNNAFRQASSSFTPGTPAFLAQEEGMPHMMYFGTSDGHVYRVETDRGNILARFSAGEPISQSPVVVKDNAFAVTDQHNLFCMHSQTMQENWQVPGIRQILAASQTRLYVADVFRRIVVLDIATGSRLGTVPIGDIDFLYTNNQSDRIYLGSTTGVMQCLREASNTYPWVHRGTKIEKKFQQVLGTRPDEAAEPAEEETKPVVEDDPFNAPAAKPMPAAAVDDDPFAS
jgi:outer membrane protein assembly factor BamB